MTSIAPSARRVKVAILAPEHALGWTIMGPADMLNSAGGLWSSLQGGTGETSRFNVRIVGRTQQPVSCYHGTRLIPEISLDDTHYVPDVVLVPGLFEESVRFGRSGWSTPWRPFVQWIRERHDRGALVGAISTGVALLAETGLLDRHQATTHWALMPAMAAHYSRVQFVSGQALVAAAAGSRLITTAAGTAWQALVLLLIARFVGSEQAVELARLFSSEPTTETATVRQRGFIPPRDHGDASMLRAQRALSASLGQPDALGRAMDEVQLSRRTFERRFRAATGYSPLAYLQELRMQRARHLLGATTCGIDEIAIMVGYNDVPFFRNLFTRMSGITPSRYRGSFGMGELLEKAKTIL
jgi:transcriptional regulator GlxA family with amidase domain